MHRRKQLNSAITRWWDKANEVQEVLTDSEYDEEIRNIRQELDLCMAEPQEAFHNDQALDPGDPLSIEEFGAKRNQIHSIIGESIRDTF